MSAYLKWCVYRQTGPTEHEEVARTRYPEDAAAVVAMLGDGAMVLDLAGRILWTEGEEEFPAAESYDQAAEVMVERREGPAPVVVQVKRRVSP